MLCAPPTSSPYRLGRTNGVIHQANSRTRHPLSSILCDSGIRLDRTSRGLGRFEAGRGEEQGVFPSRGQIRWPVSDINSHSSACFDATGAAIEEKSNRMGFTGLYGGGSDGETSKA
ncbi:hypothetical protein DPEC_G00116610 [Dallia pectoralis]|uniref:Uncharacterized protein n=1 Tax=Dallia pectoralis TaxID=75939 RepID=A0ACC2GUY7_DALPE|nr:hypothetical protein DPEC_G00116610 [Dallia pectoralis]